MSREINLNRRTPTRPLISLVPMIDVMLILLVFFMVTSTYLNLDMIPALAQSDRPAPASVSTRQDASGVLLIRIGADGAPHFQGRQLEPAALTLLLRERLTQNAATQVIILPTGSARLQSLVSVMDVVTQSGVVNLRVVRLEGRP